MKKKINNIKLNLAEYKDKVYACWIGKNIGGTMGAPYEGTHDILDIKGYVTEANVVLPNDDLDLQLIWLLAVKKFGPYQLNAATLGEFWLDYIVPYWNEYGIGKANMRRGFYPPLCGDLNNDWKHSNGAWIRTEIWATLAPASPDVAAKFAIEDAVVDHGTGEGTVAAAFVAAMQSAAFVCNDIYKIIDVGLSKIPAESRMADSVRFAIECYQKGIPAMEARNLIQQRNADIGNGWFEAPSNVAYAVLGLLYGEGDFKKSMITAINCGDDTDCTAATVGATLGIMYGTAGIPKDWQAHIGDSIVTVSLNLCTGPAFPTTCTELTNEVVALAPDMLAANKAPAIHPTHCTVELTDGEEEIPSDILDCFLQCEDAKRRLTNLKPNSFEITFGPITATVTYDRTPDVRPNDSIGVHVRFENNWRVYGNTPHNLSLRWILPEGFSVEGVQTLRVPAYKSHLTSVSAEADFIIHTGEVVNAVNRPVLEAVLEGHYLAGYVPMVLLG